MNTLWSQTLFPHPRQIIESQPEMNDIQISITVFIQSLSLADYCIWYKSKTLARTNITAKWRKQGQGFGKPPPQLNLDIDKEAARHPPPPSDGLASAFSAGFGASAFSTGFATGIEAAVPDSICPSIHVAHLRSTHPSKSYSPYPCRPAQRRPTMPATTPRIAITAKTTMRGPTEPLESWDPSDEAWSYTAGGGCML